ncbi:Uncharacterised protein [Amycolatopsis camponoti]|uniref:Uncharacterized protein n=1 Tax=Amycolatopsis camponoti TaxID=2606593 RepID=A0A6I8M2U3_9PSEU|nr:type VII secretion target [Amycolatopsis camponoti]VVJ23032.1 Uncharacterised protein [Amycolatopsis camponoti]
MDGYAVKAGELGKLIDDLDTAADRMADANRKLGGGGAFGSLGTAELGRAGIEFEEAWGYGIGRLGEAASEISERLKQAKQKYERIEAEFGDELAKFGSAVLGADGKVGGGVTGGVPGIDDLAGRDGPAGIGDLGGDDGKVGGGVTGGVPGVGDLAGGDPRPAGGVPGMGDLGGGGGRAADGGVRGLGGGDDRPAGGAPGLADLAGGSGGGMVGGGATGGITDLLNGLDR